MTLLRDVKSDLGSSYLVDHADNPVLWRTWDADALEESRTSDRPLFLSIGYAACHWCHVMAHESFENETIAEVLNEFFVPVKVDREERPDVDALYMAATQLVSGHGGWPMSVFLLSDGRPFMAGTYYPPTDRAGQVGFLRLLTALRDAWANQRELIERQADELMGALTRDVHFIDHLAPHVESIDLGAVRTRLCLDLVEQADSDGGFGGAPKFPRPSFVTALYECNDARSREVAGRTLDAMSRRGLYDHFRGGFARYSVDAEWHVPHFEKMLSDQALLARCYLRAARLTGNQTWRDVALDTLAFVERDLRLAAGYASSLDADAGGVEGSHITWTPDEVREVLAHFSDDTIDAVLTRWRIADSETFEGRSIPRLSDAQPFLTPPDLLPAYRALLAAREQRAQPSRDSKIVLEWNAMLASAFLLSGVTQYQDRALALLASLRSSHFAQEVWWRTEHQRAQATASDLAWLIDASMDAYELTGDDEWRAQAVDVATYLVAHYWDGSVPSDLDAHVGGGFFTQSDLVGDLATRPKEIFDGATPSSHAICTRALARLALSDGSSVFLVIAQRLVEIAGSLIVSHPSAVVDLVEAAGFALDGVEVVIPGEPNELSDHLRSMAMSRAVLVSGLGTSGLLAGRSPGFAYVCRAGVCELPVSSVNDLEAELKRSGAWPS
ncbi:MAG TPA: thioredoxin domain-containing protein [Acidimicrobiales bacterium]|nr:thioredoxin domain-containing protein [Acidimicrobiales bacterium]